MKPRRSLLVRLGLVLALMLMTFVSPAYAKEGDEKLPPYDVQGLTHTRVWVPWVFAFLFTGGCVAAALKNPHRTMSER
jgi:hypothetical protein